MQDSRIMDALLPGCCLPSSGKTIAGWEAAFLDLIPTRSRSTHVVREVTYTVSRSGLHATQAAAELQRQLNYQCMCCGRCSTSLQHASDLGSCHSRS